MRRVRKLQVYDWSEGSRIRSVRQRSKPGLIPRTVRESGEGNHEGREEHEEWGKDGKRPGLGMGESVKAFRGVGAVVVKQRE
jgi:hypothetical protein